MIYWGARMHGATGHSSMQFIKSRRRDWTRNVENGMQQINLRTRRQLHSRWQLRDDVMTLTDDDSVHYGHTVNVGLYNIEDCKWTLTYIGKSTYSWKPRRLTQGRRLVRTTHRTLQIRWSYRALMTTELSPLILTVSVWRPVRTYRNSKGWRWYHRCWFRRLPSVHPQHQPPWVRAYWRLSFVCCGLQHPLAPCT